MALVFRMYKYEIPMIIRYYGTNNHQQRSKCNHYEVLNISSNATQKEIKEAYIKLSKQMHPDSGTGGSHKDFVRLNEAYTILSKSDTKSNYDTNLKRNYTYTCQPHMKSSYQRPQYTYEDWGFAHPTKHNPFNAETRLKGIMFCLAVMIGGTIIQVFLIEKSFVFKRREMLLRSQKYEAEYQKIKEDTKNKSFEEKIQKLCDLQNQQRFKNE